MPKVALTTLGCKVNQVETEIMEGLFRNRGYEIVDFSEPADFYIINTCSVTHLGERKSRQLIRRANRLNDNAIKDKDELFCLTRYLFEKIQYKGHHFYFYWGRHIFQKYPSFKVNDANVLKHFIKDLKIATSESKVPLTGVKTVINEYLDLVDRGYSEKGTQCLIEYFK